MGNMTQQDTQWLDSKTNELFTIIDNYGTNTEARLFITEMMQEVETKARIDELEGILSAKAEGRDFAGQMAAAVGHVGKRYQELVYKDMPGELDKSAALQPTEEEA